MLVYRLSRARHHWVYTIFHCPTAPALHLMSLIPKEVASCKSESRETGLAQGTVNDLWQSAITGRPWRLPCAAEQYPQGEGCWRRYGL